MRSGLLHLLGFLMLAGGGSLARAQATDGTSAEQEQPVATSESDENMSADDGTLLFNFRYQPWQDVLDWFADEADLSLLVESPPPGTFNYRDTRRYTPAEALDVLNGVLLTKGYTLVRNGRMLVLVNLEDGIPPNLVPDVPLKELDSRGEYELIRVLFPVWSMTPELAAEEIKPLLGPQGAIVVLPQARAIQVTETAGRLRTIRGVINAVEQPEEVSAGVREFELKHLTVDAAMPTIRQMLGIPEESFSTPDGTLHITKSTIGEKLLVRGTAQHAARLEEVLRLIDVPEAAAGVAGVPQMEVYPVTTASPEAVLKVLQAMMRDDPNVHLTTDPETGYLVAFARPSQHGTIRATIDQMQKDARQVDVIPLADIDPQVAVLAINKLFGGVGEEPDPSAPRVDADVTTRSLLVRGTAGQVEQIRGLLAKLGESGEGAGLAGSRENVRLLPLTGAEARRAVAQIQEIWPSVRSNRIRVITPTESIRIYRPNESGERYDEQSDSREDSPAERAQEMWEMFLEDDPSAAVPSSSERGGAQTLEPARDRTAGRNGAVFRLAASQLDEESTQDDETTEAAERRRPPPRSKSPESDGRKAAILIAPGPGGTLIASDDTAALNDLEELLSIVAGRSSSSGREYAVFYLKYSKAPTIAEVLAAIFGGRAGSRDGGLVGDMASEALGNVGGALMGDLLFGGGGGGGFSSGSIEIVPDARLNALIVHAKPADLDTIEQLLKVLDQRIGPEEVEAETRPRLIPVYNTEASEIAEVVQQVYQDRMLGAAAMSPQDMMRMLRGNGPSIQEQIQPMSIGVDERSNSLVVRAPDPLFEEVKILVAALDEEQLETVETTRVVSLQHTNSAAVHKALTSVLNGVSTNGDSSDRDERRRRDRDDDDDSPQERARRAMRRQLEVMEEFQELRQRMQRDREGGERGRGDWRGRGGRGGGRD